MDWNGVEWNRIESNGGIISSVLFHVSGMVHLQEGICPFKGANSFFVSEPCCNADLINYCYRIDNP